MTSQVSVAVVTAVVAGLFSLTSVGLSVWGTFRTTDLKAELNRETFKLQGQLDLEADDRRAEIETVKTNLEESLVRRGAFLERQLELYFEVAAVTGKIATASEGADKELAKRRFRELYWGELAVVEDFEVQRAMVEFELVLRRSDSSTCIRREQQVKSVTEPTL